MNAPSTFPKERSVQRSILAMCGALFPEVFIHHSPNGAQLAGNPTARFKQIGALKGDGFKPGFPDLIFLWKGGAAFIEVKREKGGKISEPQQAMHERLESLGWPVATVTTPEAAYVFLRGCGAPCRGSHDVSAPIAPTIGRVASGIFERRLKGPLPAPVSRDPCVRCGCRGDLDCGHKATRLLTMIGRAI